MKNFKLFSIFLTIIFTSMFSVWGENVTCTYKYYNGTHCTHYESSRTLDNETHYDINLTYPSDHIYFNAKINSNASRNHNIKVDVYNRTTDNWSNKIDKDLKSVTSYTSYDCEIDKENNTQVAYYMNKHWLGGKKINIQHFRVKMATHTRLAKNGVAIADGSGNSIANALSLETFGTEFYYVFGSGAQSPSATINFYSYLVGSDGMTITVVDKDDKEKKDNLTLSTTTITNTANDNYGFASINSKSFKITYTPSKIESEERYIKIYNKDALNETIYIKIKLNSSLPIPTGLKCDASGYTFAKLSWNEVNEAESYNVYDNGTKVENNITFNGTSATITGLAYASSHSYTVTSVVGSVESNKSKPAVTVNCPAYPQVQNVHFTNVQQNQVTVNWNPVTISPDNHEFVRYHVRLYQPNIGGTLIKEIINPTGTSYTFDGLIDQTQYTAYVDVEYKYTLNDETKNVSPDGNHWSSVTTTTTSFITDDSFDGALMYKGVWHRVNLNTNIDISSNNSATAKEKVYTMSLNYPCEPKVDFQINTTDFWGTYGTANIKIDESKTGKWDDTNRIHAASYSGENKAGTTQTSGHDVKALQFYCDGGLNSNEYVHDIKLQIATHTKTYTERISFNTSVTNTKPDEQKIELQSVLTANNGLKFEIVEKNGDKYIPTTLSNDIITLYLSDKYKGQSFHIQSNNTLVKHKDTNKAQGKSVVAAGGWDVTIKFKPDNIFEKEVFVRITNEGAKVNPVIYIPVTLKSSLETPTLKCDASGYTFAKLSWNPIEGAEKYKLYDGNTEVGTYNNPTTSATITGLAYGSTHNYTVTSIKGSAESDKSELVTVNCPTYPTVKNLTYSNVQQNEATISWAQEDRIANHSYIEYQILVYENGTLKTDPITTTNTSITLENLTNTTPYYVKIGVKYKYELNGTHTISPDKAIENQWVSTSFTTKDPLTEAPYNEPYNGVINYKGTWYYVNLNNDFNITSNPMPINLGYPCNYLTFKAFTESFLIFPPTGNSVGVKQDGTDPEKAATETWNSANEEQDGKAEINTTTSDLSIYKYSGTSTEASPLKVKNIWLTIEPHILLKKTKYVTILTTNSTKTATSTAEIDFGTIEVDYNQQVNVNFKSFLSVGNIKATITEDNDNVFSLKDGTKELHIAGNNTLEDIYSNDHSFTITFTPNKAQNEEYSGTLVIKDDRHTIIITLKGKCIKRTPEIIWVNDKYISLGEYLAGAASSTCGTVKYELVDPNKGNIIGIDNDFNLLEGKKIGEAEIIAKVNESEKWYSAQSIATFTVTDKIIQTIGWDQDFTIWNIGDEIELTAEAITRETGEENGNEITYSITDESVAEIVDGNKLKIVGSGYTYITAHQQGNDEYAPTYMTKLVFVIETAGDSENCLALNIKEKTYSGLSWGPFEFEENLTTLGGTLSFTTTKNLATTGDYLIITDDLGNLVYNSNLGKTETNIQLPDPEAKKLTFTLGGNLQVSISNIEVTPAEYITPDKNSIAFSETKVDNRAVEEIDFEWANQPDFIIAKIEDDEAGVFSIDNKTAVFGNPDCGEHGISTVKVIFSPKEETDYTANLVVYVGDEPEPEKIPITGQGKKAEQAIYWLNITNLTTADKEVNLAYTTASSQQEITYTFISGDDVIEISNNSITVLGEGTFTLKAQQKNNNSYYDTKEITKTFNASIGNIIFDNKANNNDWNTIGNWKPNSKLNLKRNITPSANVNAVISAEAVMNDVNGEINNLTFENDGKLTIGATSGLKVNAVTNATADNLILKASANGNATFIYNSGTPSATVEMYSKATGGEKDKIPQWQYMGVAVNNATTSNFPNAWLLKWTEAENVTGDPWSDTPLAPGTTLAPWAGYSISQPQATTYTMKGALMNGNHTYELTRTESTDPDCGFNLLANSYTAPIDITKLTTSDFENADACADACIILYNTGTYEQWADKQGSSGENPGQLTVIPIETVGATGLPKTIPSMQAFFVKANTTGATFTVNYDTDVAGASNHSNQMRAPRAENEFNVLKIMIEGENTRDRLYLLENEETSKAYDNGYEARKIFDAPRGHQMYATCEYGYASIDCSESFVGQTIGLKGDNEGEMLTISFDIDRLEGYESLYLYDKVTGKYVNIVAGEKYTFFGVKGADDNRFSIVTNPDDRNQTPPFVVIGEELAFDKSQINADNANIYIYDTSGRLLIIDKVNPYENYNIPNMPKGIYLVSMNGYTTKIVKK